MLYCVGNLGSVVLSEGIACLLWRKGFGVNTELQQEISKQEKKRGAGKDKKNKNKSKNRSTYSSADSWSSVG